MATEFDVVFKTPNGTEICKSALAGASGISPCSIIIRSGTGVIVNPTADSTSDKIMVADLDKSVGGGYDAYASGDTVFFKKPLPGELVNLVLATSQTIAFGDELTTATAGQVKAPAVAGTAVRFIAHESVTTTGATAFILAEVLS